MANSQIGLIGLAVMGQNLARNIANKGFSISVFNRTTEKTDEFIKEFGTEKLTGTKTIKEFVDSLETPRKIIIMVKSGTPVDAVIDSLTPLLEKGDIIMDGGNSFYKDTARREEELEEKELHFIGMGISGGEEGALNGPSIMPGGNEDAYKQVEPILQKIAADDEEGGKCVTHVGPDAAGHFVKMVHNGIEYAIMQLIAESYDMLRKLGKLTNEELEKLFMEWNKNENLSSYLIEITSEIFAKKEDGKDLIDLIKDRAQQKGTGKWTTFAGMDYGVTTGIINAAVDARIQSDAPGRGAIALPLSITGTPLPKKDELITLAKNALELTTILCYFQGFDLIQTASKEYNWNIDICETARIWRGGCIIRSKLLPKFQDLYNKTPSPTKTEMLNEFEGEKQANWRQFASLGISNGIPVPATQAALAYYDSLRNQPLPQNLTQAQRDFFGAHTYERIDKEGTFHTEW